MTLNCVIIDDEPLARQCITGYVNEVDFLTIAGVGNNPLDLLQLLEQQAIDLIFLDIQMPKINGIDFLKSTPQLPMVIITTAYPSYALEGFQLDVMDYLVKPILFDRFFQAINKAKDYQTLLNKSSAIDQPGSVLTEDYFFIKCGHKFERICFSDVLFIEALQNYVTFFTRKGKFITQLPLKNVEQNLSGQQFIRIHKSYLVSIPKIEAIENNDIIIQSFRIPISRHYREQVMSSVVNAKLWKK
ncbi:MAG TPA: LytTR family DNA-binding domain-containing protein [Chitinophagaceae bacterium]|nr:LytTR family DNA-binding domain-containing protein [Chitinophagaceae bacterium]